MWEFSPDDPLQHTADGAERSQCGDPHVELGLVVGAEAEQPVHGPVPHQQPAEVVALQREARHDTQWEVDLRLRPGEAVHCGPDLDPEH